MAGQASSLEAYARDYFTRQRQNNFADFKGAAITGTIPLREALVNELALEAVRQNNDKLKGLQVSFLDNNLIHIKVTVKIFIATPTLDLAVQVENRQNNQGAPILRLQVTPLGGGLLDTFLPVLLGMIPVPESVTVSGRQVDINLHTVFTRRGMHEIAALIKLLQLRVRRGIAEIDFGLKVD